MEQDRRSPETAPPPGTHDVGQALQGAQAFLRTLIPFPGSELVGPLSLLPLARGGNAHADPVSGVAALVGEPAESVVAQAAAVLDEEIAKGLLAARSAPGMATQTDANASDPVLRQMQDFVDNLGALWPRLQGGPLAGASPEQSARGNAEPLPTVSPRESVKPGERATISMTLRNGERQPVRLVPTATDLIGSAGGRIPSSLLEFIPSEIALEPEAEKDLTISVPVSVDAAPGRYVGLLIVKGLDYLRALIAIDVARTTPASETVPIPITAGMVGTPGSAPTAPRSATMPGSDSLEPQPFWGGDGAVLNPRPRAPGSLTATSNQAMVQEAMRLAEDGELGNSDAIRLLQFPHRPEDVKALLARFDKQLTREAKSKLTLEAFAPLPRSVDNQRYEPIFDRYPITGKTYTTANGTVVLNEIRYYNGEMVQLHGECSNVAEVGKALDGSGYKPLTLRQAGGRESAVAQFWAHQLTDTSLGPYDAAFIVVPVVPAGTPADQASIAADESGASSALAMLGGAFDPTKGVYENRVRLFFVRLLDSTRVAIDVGRERMGTDKRPGTIRLTRRGKQRTFTVDDGAGKPVAKIGFVPTDDPMGFLPEMARAAATAGMPFRAFPSGTEYVFPSVARIGSGPVVHWQWTTDLPARLQRADPSAATFDSSSDEGGMLVRWGFKPKVLGYIPNVRGAVTGV